MARSNRQRRTGQTAHAAARRPARRALPATAARRSPRTSATASTAAPARRTLASADCLTRRRRRRASPSRSDRPQHREAAAAGDRAPHRAVRPTLPLALLGAAAFALVLGLGVLIGSLGSDDPQPVQAGRPQVITVAAATGATTSAGRQFTSDWPEDKDGYTIQLQTLPKDGTDVAAVTGRQVRRRVQGSARRRRARLRRLLEPRLGQLPRLLGRLRLAQAGDEGASRA